MKSRKRMNLGLILSVLVLAGAVLFSVLEAGRERRLLETGRALLYAFEEKEAAALIFPDDAVADRAISEAEMTAAKARLQSVLSDLYADETFRQARFEQLARDLERQAEQAFYVRSVTIKQPGAETITEQDGLLKYKAAVSNIAVEFINREGNVNYPDYSISPGVQALFRVNGHDLILVDRASAAVSRFLGDQFGIGTPISDEGGMPWQHRRPF